MKNNIVNEDTYNLLFKDKETFVFGDDEKFRIIRAINIYTLYFERKILKKICSMFRTTDYIYSINRIKHLEENEIHMFKTDNEILEFNLMSNLFIESKKELLSNDRYGCCHIKSVELARKIYDSKVVTGLVKIENKIFLHSVIQINYNNEEYYCDYTQNIVFKKNDYIDIYEFEIISILKHKELDESFNMMCEYLGFKVSLCFKNEILNDLQKNKQLFK